MESTPDAARIDEVLAFWFGAAAHDEASVLANVRRWFGGGEEIDREVRERFGATVQAAVDGELDGWASTPRGTLALVLLLDQFTRNCYRDTPRMYAGDARAQRLALDAIARGDGREMSYFERMFLTMPLLHSEDLALHERLAPLVRAEVEGAPPHVHKAARMQLEQAAKYADVIRRFGRFPHRNELLGRESTAEEREFLRGWAERAAPSGMRSG